MTTPPAGRLADAATTLAAAASNRLVVELAEHGPRGMTWTRSAAAAAAIPATGRTPARTTSAPATSASTTAASALYVARFLDGDITAAEKQHMIREENQLWYGENLPAALSR